MLHFDLFFASLPIMGWGMLGIFIVTMGITLIIYLLCKLFPDKSKKEQ